jgi:hypothetical protein
MPTKAAMPEAEYLRTTFPGVDQGYRDGELVERSVPDLFHGLLELNIAGGFLNRKESHGLHAATEVRKYIRPGRFMIPDVCVLKKLFVYQNGLQEVTAFPILEASIELPDAQILR